MRSLGLVTLLNTAALALAAPHAPKFEGTPPQSIRLPHHRRQILRTPEGYSFNVLDHLAGISPYFDSPGVHLDPTPPAGCEVIKATYLIRHSNIYANDYDYATYISPFLFKLENYSDKSIFTQVSDFAFLANYSSPITNESEQIEKLTPSGHQSAAALAHVVKKLYPALFNNISKETFKVWSATASRDVDTATSFIEGLGGGAGLTLVNQGANDSANTLTPHISCPAYHASSGAHQSRTWATKYTAPIISRFNEVIPGFNFTINDIIGMQQLCGYDDVIRNRTEFCNIFTADEWLGFEYMNDIKYFYSVGYGSTVVPEIGMPWVRSAFDILNANDTSTFNQSLYFSFSHREEPPFVLTALGLFNNSGYYPGLNVNSTMPTDRINYAREWKTSFILPFLGHVAIERMECAQNISASTCSLDPGSSSTSSPTSSSAATCANASLTATSAAFIRVLVNGAPIPIPECQDGPDDSCALGSFADYIQKRVARYGDFIGACGINDTVTNRTDLISFYDA